MTASVGGGGPSSPPTAAVGGPRPRSAAPSWAGTVVRDRVLELLKLSAADPAAERVEQAAASAAELCDSYLDRATPYTADDVPGPVVDAAVLAARDLFQRKDAPFGIYGAWSSDGEALRVARDVLAGVESMLRPYKQGWGLA